MHPGFKDRRLRVDDIDDGGNEGLITGHLWSPARFGRLAMQLPKAGP